MEADSETVEFASSRKLFGLVKTGGERFPERSNRVRKSSNTTADEMQINIM